MPTYRCFSPSHSKSVGPKSGLGWYSQSHGGHVKQASIWIRLGCLHGLHGKQLFWQQRVIPWSKKVTQVSNWYISLREGLLITISWGKYP
jgi:hypothetical protein